jgi:hypothetical protein
VDTLALATSKAAIAHLPNLAKAELSPSYFYHSLPLCMIDAVFSIGVRYGTVENVIQAWCLARDPVWQKYRVEGLARFTIEDFLEYTAGFGGEALANRFFGGNRQRTSTRSGILKADATILYAKALKSAGISDFDDIRTPEKADKARSAARNVPGHASGISFDYFQMLSGDDNFVKADRMVRRFVANAAGISPWTLIEPVKAGQAVREACALLQAEYPNLTPRLLDHAIWKHQSLTKMRPNLKSQGSERNTRATP